MSGRYKGLRALIYCRVSSDPTGRGTSVEAQEAENRAWCEREDWPVVDVIVDNDLSASRRSKRERPGYNEVQTKLATGVADILVCWESSRSTRDLEVYVQVRKLCVLYGVLYAYKGRVYDLSDTTDRFTTGLDALLDERYADEVRDRILRGTRRAAAAGQPHGKIHYAYLREHDPRTGALVRQIPNPETAPILREIVARLLGGDSVYGIAGELNRRKVPTPQQYRQIRRGLEPSGAGWTSVKIRALLRNPTVAGLRTHNGSTIGEGDWPAVIDPADYEAVRDIFKDPRRRTQRGTAPKHLLSGIAACGVCGAWLRRVMNRTIASYGCQGRNLDNPACVVVRQEPVDLYVTETLLGNFERSSVLAEVVTDPNDAEQAAAVREAANIRARLAELESAAADGGISFGAYSRFETQLRGELTDAERRATPVHVPTVITDLVGKQARARWDELTVVQRRQAVAYLLDIRVQPAAQRGVRAFEPDRVEVRWRFARSG